MRMAFLGYFHGFGGAEKQMLLLANEMVERGHEVFLISIALHNINYSVHKRINYIKMDNRGNNKVIEIIYRYIDLKKILKNISPDVTISFWGQSAYMTALMSKAITGRVVYSERGDPGDIEYSGIVGIERKLTINRIDGFVFQSRGAKEYFGKRIQDKSTIIYNYIDLSNLNNQEVLTRRKAIVNVGRIHRQKNHILLISAFALIANEFPEYTLEIYGEGRGLQTEVENLIKKLGLRDKVLLKEPCKDIHNKILDASVFVLSSDYEGLPNVLIEAMALGIPCISTDCRPGGIREIIDNNKDGIIVPIGEAAELANAMRYILLNPDKAKQLADNALNSVKKFGDKDEIYNKWERFLQNSY